MAAYISQSYINEVHDYMREVPCEARLEIRKMDRDGGAGSGVIAIDPRLRGEDLRYAVYHEVSHVCDLDTGREYEKKKIFGKEPFITEYSKRNWREDWAEEMTALVYNGYRPVNRKQRFIRRILNTL